MGLPLFIAPVESDVPSKTADKCSATSPPRSSIRRTRIERRAAALRRISLRERLADGSLQQSSSLTDRDGQSVPWIEAGFPPDTDPTTRPLRDVLRDMNASDGPRRGRIEEHLHSLFRDNTSASVPGQNPYAPPSYQRFHWPGSVMTRPVPPRPAPEDDEGPRLPPISLQVAMRDLSADAESLRPTVVPQPRLRSRYADGLGDRERSISAEPWETLLSTLTPDPQPPSAGSSFASNIASQSAGVMAGNSFLAPDLTQDTTVDQACESGCEGSETEEHDHTQSVLDRIRRRREEMRRVRVRVPDFSIDGPVNRRADRDRGAVGSEPRLRRSPDGPATNNLRRARSIRDRTNRDGILRSRHAWVGHLSVGNSDDEQPSERTRHNQESPATSGNTTHAGEEDWMSMQHIVRSLARREDIPDEWWAGAGLSRTLPGDGTE